MRRLILVVGTFALLISSIESSLAQDDGWYVGFDAGQTDVGIVCPTTPCDDSDFGWHLFAGYQFSKVFGLKAGYLDLGAAKSGLGTIEFDGFDVLGTATWNINDRWSIYGELGAYSLNADFKVGPSTDGSGATGALGGAFKAGDRLSLRLQYQVWMDVGEAAITGESDIGLYSVGIVYSF